MSCKLLQENYLKYVFGFLSLTLLRKCLRAKNASLGICFQILRFHIDMTSNAIARIAVKSLSHINALYPAVY